MHPVDNSQFTEEQRAETFREFHADHLRRQTKALETIRAIAVALVVLVGVGVVIWLVSLFSAGNL